VAGKVHCRVLRSGDGLRALNPEICPATGQPGSSSAQCAMVDVHYSHGNLCPFLSRLVIQVGGSVYDVWTMDALMQWLGSQDVHGGQWTALCLRCDSSGTEVGARLRL